MTDEAGPRARPGNAAANGAAAPDELEKRRLRFEIELARSQDAGASLDPELSPSKGPAPVADEAG